MQEDQSIAEILTSIRQILSKEAETLRNNVPPEKKPVPEVFELTPQMRFPQGELVTPQTTMKAQASLEKLDAFKEPPAENEPPEQTILERELKPLLQAWLNEHLPVIVEDVVTREVRRIINRN